MTSELSGLELRKSMCEALGWRSEQLAKKDWWHSPQCAYRGPTGMQNCDLSSSGCSWELPAIESDPGVFWPEFEKWWKSVEWPGDGFVQGNNYSCGLGSCHWFDIYLRGQRYNYRGNAKATLLEAGCRAWLQALHDRAPQSAGSSRDEQEKG